MDERKESSQNRPNHNIQETRKKKSSPIKLLKFEDRMKSIIIGEFQIKDNDFPSLSNDTSQQVSQLAPEVAETKPPLVSYSETVSKSRIDLKQLKNDMQVIESISTEQSNFVVKKKKRKRQKKKKPELILTNPKAIENDENVEINLEDLEEYPTLNTSVKVPVVKSISTIAKTEILTMEVKKADISKENIPGVLKVSPTALKSQTKATGKKSKTPVEINIFDVIIKPKKQGEIKAKKLNPTFNVKKGKFNNINKISPHNVLDSTAPVRKRGKERENPKKVKLSKLKKIILYERAIRKQLQAQLCVNIGKNSENFPPNEPEAKIIEEMPDTLKIKEEMPHTLKIIEEMPDTLKIKEEMPETSKIIDKIDTKITEDEIKVKNEHEATKVKTILEVAQSPESLKTELNENIFVISTIEDDKEQREMVFCIKKIVHSRKYRDYCNQRISQEIDTNLEQLLQDLVRFQDRQFQKDPVKAKIKKRMVFGLKEVTKNLKINRIKFVIIAPDVERILAQGGLNDAISNLIQSCNDHKIPVVFGLPRRKLGFICKKSVPLSCIGVISYEGKEELYKHLMDLVMEARESYRLLVEQIEKLITPQLQEILIKPETNDKILQEIKRNIFLQLECRK